jgi:hypothetical protein
MIFNSNWQLEDSAFTQLTPWKYNEYTFLPPLAYSGRPKVCVEGGEELEKFRTFKPRFEKEACRKASKCAYGGNSSIEYRTYPSSPGLPEFCNTEGVVLLWCRLWMNKTVPVECHHKLHCYFIGTANYRIEV